VDGLASGIDWHEAVDLATAAALPNSPVYDNGSSGVGATLTSSTQARLVVDGANATTGDRILVKNESTGAHNGIYVVTAQGAAASAQWVLTRATDFDGGVTGEVVPGEAVLALNGSTNAKQGFVVTSTSDPHSIGSDAITFTQFTGTQSFTAGDGLTQTGNTLDVVTADSNRIVVNSDSIDLATVYGGATTGVSTSDIVSALTVDSYGRITAMTTGTVGQNLKTTDSPTFVSVTADLVGDVTGTVSDISNHDLTDIGNVTITGASSGEFLKWNGSAWINASIPEINTLNDVGNVTITTVSTGDILEWNGTAWVNTTLAFDDLSDVDMTTLAPSEGDVAYYDGSNWVPYALTIQNAGNVSTSGEASGDILLYNGTNYVNTPHTLANITNVTLTSEADGEFLKYNGSAWVNAAIPEINTLNDVGNVNITSVQDGEFLKWDSGTSKWINAAIPEINTLNDVGNVTITSASSGEVLQWNGTAWVNIDVLANTALTGTPTAPTAATTTNTTQVATTAFVQQEIAALVDSAPESLNTLNELAAALADDAAFSTTVTDSLALKAPLASPTFTGTVTLPAGTSMLHDYVTYSTNHTLVAGNEGQTLQFSAAGTLTVPTNASVAFPVGTMITIFQTGTGQVTVAGAAGVTVNGAVGLKTREQWSAIVLHKRGTDTWLVTGDASA
jgi:hypothetical protein